MNTNSAVNSTAPSTSNAKIYFGYRKLNITADQVLAHLDQHGLIAWQPAVSGNLTGNVTTILEDIWEAGIAGAMASLGNFSHHPIPSLHKRHQRRNWKEAVGNIAGYAGEASCYVSGSVDTGDDITGYAVQACDALVGNAAPPLVKNALKVFQTASMPDFNNVASYVRFSTKLLTTGFGYTEAMCTDALQSFSNICEKTSGRTYGGEITVGDAVMCKCFQHRWLLASKSLFELKTDSLSPVNADVTQYNCNC